MGFERTTFLSFTGKKKNTTITETLSYTLPESRTRVQVLELGFTADTLTSSVIEGQMVTSSNPQNSNLNDTQ